MEKVKVDVANSRLLVHYTVDVMYVREGSGEGRDRGAMDGVCVTNYSRSSEESNVVFTGRARAVGLAQSRSESAPHSATERQSRTRSRIHDDYSTDDVTAGLSDSTRLRVRRQLKTP